jgi:hypothetical protein
MQEKKNAILGLQNIHKIRKKVQIIGNKIGILRVDPEL